MEWHRNQSPIHLIFRWYDWEFKLPVRKAQLMLEVKISAKKAIRIRETSNLQNSSIKFQKELSSLQANKNFNINRFNNFKSILKRQAQVNLSV